MCKKIGKKKSFFFLLKPQKIVRENEENQEFMHSLTSEMQQTYHKKKRIKLIEYRKIMTRLKAL